MKTASGAKNNFEFERNKKIYGRIFRHIEMG